MKNSTFNVLRFAIRFTYSLSRGARRFWRALLAWGRVARIQSFVLEKLKVFRECAGSKGNHHRKDLRESDSNQTRPPFR